VTELLKERQYKHAANVIQSGGTVAFRTETVYGLGADATNPAAVSKIYTAKGRPDKNPLIVHFASCRDVLELFPDLDRGVVQLLKKIKTALTIVIDRKNALPDIVSAGLPTVAIRIPACRSARRFIRACKTPIAAPSANTSTRPSPTDWRAVHEDLNGRIDAILMGSRTQIGVESTVIKIKDQKILVLRLGGCCTKTLEKISGMPVEIVTDSATTVASPGTHFKHYAPNAEMYTATYGINMIANINNFIKDRTDVIVLCARNNKQLYPTARVIDLGGSSTEIQRNIFRAIRDADKQSKLIIAEGFPTTPEYEAVNERLTRAAGGRTI
jgi:L-threonylcarbamoyladenylate synthase